MSTLRSMAGARFSQNLWCIGSKELSSHEQATIYKSKLSSDGRNTLELKGSGPTWGGGVHSAGGGIPTPDLRLERIYDGEPITPITPCCGIHNGLQSMGSSRPGQDSRI